MDVIEFINNKGQKTVPNPNYNSRSKKNKQPSTITMLDLDPNDDDAVKMAMFDYQHQFSIGSKEVDKYRQQGINWNNWENLDKQLAEKQGAGEKLWNAAKQTVVSELLLGIPKGFADIFDYIVTGFDPDDYNNPVSQWFKEQQEAYEAANPIYTDPDVNILNGGLTDIGWIASNLPSVASTLTLLIPGMGVSKGLSFLGNATKLNKAVGFTRRTLTGLKNFDRLSEVEQAAKLENLGTVAKWINTKGKDITNAAIENGVNALTMRAAENYQEAQDTYKQMYEQANDKFKNMSDEEFDSYLNTHKELKDANITSKDEAAKYIAKRSADTTFEGDKWNVVFDFFELSALRDVGKLAKNVTLSSSARKASRLARKQALIDAGLLTEDEAKETLLTNIGNFISDHRGSGKVLLAELSEGVEEAVNYISQQEGLHYGNLMLDNVEKSSFSNRLNSYLKSPELYDAAFWGWMGGILFQGIGGKIKQFANNTIDKYIANRNNKNNSDKTGEKSTTWSDRFETATSKRQVEEINGRINLAEEARRKLDMINNDSEGFGKNPYETLEDGTTPKTITSESERQALRERVRDEYITDLTIKAIDNGTYDDLMLYLHDEGVNKKLKQYGIEEEGNETVIAKMEEVAKRYENNLLAINTISGAMSGGVPMEYQQIIARDNTYAQISIADIDRRLQQYNVAAEHHRLNVFSGALEDAGFDPNDDSQYKAAVFLAEASQRLGELKAQKKAILEDKESSNTLDSQDALRLIDRQIDAINKQLTSSDDNIFNLARLVWAHGASTNFVYDEITGKTKVVSNTDKSAALAVALNDIIANPNRINLKALNEALGVDLDEFSEAKIKYKLADEDIIKLFGGEQGNGQYQILKSDMQRVYPIEQKQLKEARDKEARGIKSVAPLLHEDYVNISALQFAKIYHQALINNNKKNISRRVQELDNYMNEARKKALEKAYTILDTLEEKYGISSVMDYLNDSNAEIQEITDSEKKTLNDALAVINLQNESNASLRDTILYRLIQNKTRRNNNKANDDAESNTTQSQSSATFQQVNTEPQQSQLNNTPQSTQQQAEGTPNGQNLANNNQQQQAQSQNEQLSGKLQFSLNLDGDLTFTTVADTNDNQGVRHSEDADGNITLNYKEQPELASEDNMSEPLFNRLFNITDKTPSDYTGETKTTVAINPIIKKDDNGKWQVIQKGEYVIEAKDSSTGGQAENSQTSSTQKEEGQITPEEINNENKNAQYVLKVQQAFSTKRKEADFKNKPIEQQIQEVVNQIQADPSYKSEDKQNLNYAINVLANLLNARGIQTDIARVILQSSITETTATEFADDYIKSVDKLVSSYAAKFGLPTINGKTYINLEDALRNINNLYNDKAVADMIYQQMINYITSNIGKNKYVITDSNPNSPDFIDNVRKTLEQRITEQIAEESIYRVNIDAYFNSPSKKFLEAFDKLHKGDTLSIKVDQDAKRIFLQIDGITIGDIPLAELGLRGGYVKHNMGWKTDVDKHNDTITSDLMTALSKFISDENNINTLKKLWRYSYDTTLNKADKATLANDIYNELKKEFNNFIVDDASKQDVVQFMSNIMRYIEPTEKLDNDDILYLNGTLNNLFNTFYESYSLASELYNNGENQFTITVDKITEGQINNNRLNTNKSNYNPENYDLLEYVDKAIDEAHKTSKNGRTIEIGFVDPHTNDILLSDRSIQRRGLRKGNIYVVISNGSEEAHIIGTAVKLSDTKGSKPLQDLNKAVTDELNRRVNKAINSVNTLDAAESWDNFIFYLYQVCGNRSKKWNGNRFIDKTCPNITPLMIGANWTVNNGFININAGNTHIQLKQPGVFRILESGNWNEYNLNTEEGANKFKQVVGDISKNLVYNIPENLVRNISTGSDTNGLYTISNGSFNLSIPNSETGKSYQINATNFVDFVMSTGIIKIDTHIGDNGSNFERKGTNQKANQLLNIRIDRKTTLPVEDVIINNAEEDTKAIINNPEIKHKGKELVKDVLSEQALNTLDTLHLLPESIIFVENFNDARVKNGITYYDGDNAVIDVTTNTVTIGNRWISMFNETGEFAGANGNYRKQAIRKLIHESLHARLHEKGYTEYIKKIKTIYNEFKASLDNATDEQKTNLQKYLKLDESDTTIRLEEFLVESLTSGELVEYLNSVEAKGSSKKDISLWDKFLQLFNELFDFVGFEIKKGSLFEKELDALQKAFNNIEKPAKQPRKRRTRTLKNKKTNTPTYVEGTLEFKEEEIKPAEPKPDETLKEESKTVPIGLDALKALGTIKKINRGSSITEGVKITNDYTFEMQSIKNKAIVDGTFMKAPNGNPTNLNERQWLQVRTKSFINWFGDWINNPESSSKVIDENGEPMVVYHGTKTEWTVLDSTKFGTNTDEGYYGKGLYSSSVENKAKQYGNTIALFVKILNPIRTGIDPLITLDEATENVDIAYNFNRDSNKAETYDGVLYSGSEGLYEEIVIKDPNQIKSATDNVGTFSTTDDNIRHSSITEKVNYIIPNMKSLTDRLPLTEQAEFIGRREQGEYNLKCSI